MALPVLWQFRLSHYNEKARWALDWKGIAHVRRSLVPGLHIPRVLWMTGQKSVLFPAVRALMKLDMQIDDARAETARAKVHTALDRIAAELQPSGYLVGDRFTVADLTAAALLSPLVAPVEYPYPLPGPYPPAAAALCNSVSGHPAWQWAEEMYHRHRGHSQERAA